MKTLIGNIDISDNLTDPQIAGIRGRLPVDPTELADYGPDEQHMTMADAEVLTDEEMDEVQRQLCETDK